VSVSNANFLLLRPFQVNNTEELDRVLEIAKNSLTEYYSPKLIVDLYEEWPEGFSVAEVHHKVAGFLIGSRYSSSEARILMIAVEKSYRKMGIGSSLLTNFIDLCMKKNFSAVRLEVKTDNEEAIKLYKKFNFEITSRISAYYSDASDAFTMWRTI
jgi:ribosomal-protein-alanine N-acetyltransferase